MIYHENITCQEVLDAWDAGESVWSVEMGGLGPGYEQCIQVLAIECLRELVKADFQWPHKAKAAASWDDINPILDPVVERVNKWPGMGFSGAQVGAAKGIACKFHRYGPRYYEKAPQGRQIQISRQWPASRPEGP